MSSPVWTAVAASLVVSLSSFGGVLVLRLHQQTSSSRLVEYMTTFAAGCLLGVVAFHLLPESFEKIQADKETPEWLPGGLVIGGVVLSLVIEMVAHVWLGNGEESECSSFQHGHSHGGVKLRSLALPTDTPTASSSAPSPLASATSTEENDEPSDPNDHSLHDHRISVIDHKTPGEAPAASRLIAPIAYMTAVGDFCHAFTDGVVLAVAFQSCSASLGWAVAFGIVLHEVPHRIGDFFVFIGAGLTTQQALLLNLLASCGSLLGVIVIFSLGSVPETTLGGMLAVGAGSLLFIALTELLPPMLAVHDHKAAIAHVCWFVMGCSLIWLSALREVECDATTTDTT